MQSLDRLGRVEAGDVPEARQSAARLVGGVQQGREHRGKIGDVGDVVAVDQPHGLVGVEARDEDAGAARVHVGQRIAERGDVKERQRQEIAVRRAHAEGGHGGQIGRDDVPVGERGAARDHVHRRRGDDGEHVIGCHVGGGRGRRPRRTAPRAV